MNKNTKSKKNFGMYLKSISKVSLDKDDVIVVHSEQVFARNLVEDFIEYVNKFFPDNKVLFMGNGLKVDIISKTNIKEEV